jgi:hypothetical protein
MRRIFDASRKVIKDIDSTIIGHTVVCGSFLLQLIFLVVRDRSYCTLLYETARSRTRNSEACSSFLIADELPS